MNFNSVSCGILGILGIIFLILGTTEKDIYLVIASLSMIIYAILGILQLPWKAGYSVRSQSCKVRSLRQLLPLQRSILGNAPCTLIETVSLRDLRGNNIPIDRRAQALRPYSNGFCPQCRGELRSPKRYIIKAQVPKLRRLD